MARKPTPPPFSLRLTLEERAQLEQDAAGMSLGEYIRSRLFTVAVSAPRVQRTRGKQPVKDHQALGQILGLLGASRIASNLNQLAYAANVDNLNMTPDDQATIQAAYEEVRSIRQLLMQALGFNSREKEA
jgi:phosphoglycerate dehydrogenase-like enzyme